MKLTIEQMAGLLKPFKDLKSHFPFRLGCTSYIYPGQILPNVELLGDFFDEIQIPLFEGLRYSNLPDPSVVDHLKRLASEKNIRYSVHLPLDAYTGHDDETIRRESVRMIEHIYRIGRSFDCENFVFHYVNKTPDGKICADIRKWRDQLRKSTEELLSMGIVPGSLCVENLAYPFSLVTDLVDTYGLSKCIDIGHLRVNSHPVNTHLKRHMAKTKVIHLHGLKRGVDHNGLSRKDRLSIRKLFRRIEEFAYRETIILEVFQFDHLLESLNTFRYCWNRWQRQKLH
ncbi:sugar phosphate isomerase/epimerase [bacterium]|nr:sugar phosphate isomerase/epimerase [bacterium]MCI0606317.1 sugar phosphate isomerase/epimerase [bacterium]